MKKMQRILEYVAIALMVLNIVGYALHKSISCIALFGVGAYIARCFSKNLTINIFAGLLVSNVFFGCSLREGWENLITTAKKKYNKTINNVKKSARAKQDQITTEISEKVVKAQSGVTSKMNGDTGCVVNAYGNKWIGDMTDEEKQYKDKNLTPNDRDKAMFKYSKQLPIKCANIKNQSDCGVFGGRVHWCEWKKADAESCVVNAEGNKWIDLIATEEKKMGKGYIRTTSDDSELKFSKQLPIKCANIKNQSDCDIIKGINGDPLHWCEWK
jgi:hypothetical protein